MDTEANVMIWGPFLMMFVLIVLLAVTTNNSKEIQAASVSSSYAMQLFDQHLDLFLLNAEESLRYGSMKQSLELGKTGGFPVSALASSQLLSSSDPIHLWYTDTLTLKIPYIAIPPYTSRSALGTNIYQNKPTFALVVVSPKPTKPIDIIVNGVERKISDYATIIDLPLSASTVLAASLPSTEHTLKTIILSDSKENLVTLQTYFNSALEQYTSKYSIDESTILETDNWQYIPARLVDGTTELLAFSPTGVVIEGNEESGNSLIRSKIWRTGFVTTQISNPYWKTATAAATYAASVDYSQTKSNMISHINSNLPKSVTYTRHICGGSCSSKVKSCNELIEEKYDGTIFSRQTSNDDGISFERKLFVILNPSNGDRLWTYTRSSVQKTETSDACKTKDVYSGTPPEECTNSYVSGKGCYVRTDVVETYDTCSVTCTYTYEPDVVLTVTAKNSPVQKLYDGKEWKDFVFTYGEKYHLTANPTATWTPTDKDPATHS